MKPKLPVYLEPARHVRHNRGNWIASNPSAWLRLHFRNGIPDGRWIKLSYKCSFLDRLVRPVMRFESAEGSVDHSMAAALFGQATWIGRVPAGTTSILISPVDRTGPFGFELTEYSFASRLGLLAKSFASAKMNTAMAVGARIIGARQELEQMIKFAMGGVDFENYHEMRTERLRPFEPHGIDRPRINWAYGPEVRLVVRVANGWDARIRTLVRFLETQPYPRWSLAIVVKGNTALPIALHGLVRRKKIVVAQATDPVSALRIGLKKTDMVAAFDLDDRLGDYAIAVVAERAFANPTKTILYGDEDHRNGFGRYLDPCLKPDWSPIFEARQPYVGSDFFVRAELLSKSRLKAGEFGPRSQRLLFDAPAACIGHIRRILVSRAQEAQRQPLAPLKIVREDLTDRRRDGRLDEKQDEKRDGRRLMAAVLPRAKKKGYADPYDRPVASIIIPTKDQASLLEACIDGLKTKTAPANFEVIIVDNGSVEPQTFELFDRLKTDTRFRILKRPGPFNFSNLCNDAASVANSDVLVFMNNDIAMIDDGWLSPLIDLATRPDIGAVGAKLLFPSGKLQHAGVIVGMGGFADHIHRNDEPSSSGYLDRLSVPHELSAVTGACVAVEKTKFWAINGFDGANLPVELNDIDLCLRLGEKGWKTIFTPESVLIHHQSASRGFSVKPFKRYHKERVYFRARWAALLRDDPYFNPALSLFSVKPMLG